MARFEQVDKRSKSQCDNLVFRTCVVDQQLETFRVARAAGAMITQIRRGNLHDGIVAYPYAKNYLYLIQRISAVIIVLFLAFHVLGMKGLWGGNLEFVPADATRSTVRHINSSVWVAYLVYPIGILASCFHLANGFFTAAITWGLTISSGSQRRWGYVCTGLFFFTLLCGFLALGAAIHDKAILIH